MPIDPSIPLQIQAPKPINLLTTASQVQGLRNAQMQNLLLHNANQAFQSELAAGRDFQNAIGANGQLNQPALNLALKSEPQAAFAAPDMSKVGLANIQQLLANHGVSLQQAMQRMTWTGAPS